MAIYYLVNDSRQYLYKIDKEVLIFGYSALNALIFLNSENAIKFKKEINLNYKVEIKILKQLNKKCEILKI